MLEAASGAGATISLGSIFPGAAGDDVAGLFSLRGGQSDWNPAMHTVREIFETVAMKEAAN